MGMNDIYNRHDQVKVLAYLIVLTYSPRYGGDARPTHMLLFDVVLLKNPVLHDWHSG